MEQNAFWRILDNKLYSVASADRLGFDWNDIPKDCYIPEKYLVAKNFVLMRTCHGIGDWGILTAMPRILKREYKDCKVYIPSTKLLETLFHSYKGNWPAWSDPFNNQNLVFENNPYIDGKVDEVEGEIYHDHFRIYDSYNLSIPLVIQMLKFWRIDNVDFLDVRPELYFSQEEIDEGEKIINDIFGKNDYCVLVITNRHNYDDNRKNQMFQEYLDKYKDLPFLYYNGLTQDIPYNFNKHLDIKSFGWTNIRKQLYITTRAKAVFGTQTGVIDITSKYTPTYVYLPGMYTTENYVEGITYII